MAYLSFLPVGIPSGRLVYRPVYPQIVVHVVPVISGGGARKRRKIVRRADFSSQEAYQLALKIAMQDAYTAVLPSKPEPIEVQLKKADRQIRVSAPRMAELQKITEMEELDQILLFVSIIESEFE